MIKVKLNPISEIIYNGFISEKKYELPPTSVDKPYSFTWNITVVDDNINVKFVNDTDSSVQYNFVIPYSIIKQNTVYDTQTLYALKDEFLDKFLTQVAEDGTIEETSQAQRNIPLVADSSNIIEITSYTLPTKSNLDTGINRSVSPDELPTAETHGATQCMFKILVPYKDCPATDLEFIIRYPNDENITLNFVPDHPKQLIPYTVPSALTSNAVKYFNQLTITANTENPVAGQDIVLTVTSEDTNIPEVLVQQRVGFLNKTRIKLTNGVGNVTVDTRGLEAGDEVVVKFGYRYFTNAFTYSKVLA